MPTQGVSVEFVEDREDEMALLITAADHIDRLRVFAQIMYQRQFVERDYYRDIRDSLDLIAAGNRIGRRNTAVRRETGL